MGEVNVAFREPVHKIIDRIKNEPFFRWSNKMGEDLSRTNQNLYCTYHRDKGHTTKQCQVLKDHLGQLVKAGYLKEFMADSGNQGVRQGAPQRGHPLPLPLGVIKVIHVALKSTAVTRKGVLTVAPVENYSDEQPLKKKMRFTQ